MRLVRRLTLLLLLPIGLVFALDTALTLRSELALLDSDMRQDDAVLGRDLADAVEQVWSARGETAAFDLVDRWDAEHTGVETRIVLLDAGAGAAHAPRTSVAADVVERASKPVQLAVTRGEDSLLYTYVVLNEGGARPSALELSEPFSRARDHFARHVPGKLATVLALVLLCGVVAWRVGVRVVGEPVAALADKARRIGAGDFSAPIDLPGRDEFSVLAHETNAMAAALEVSARRLAGESAARIAALEQLRHADRLTTVGKLASGLAHELGTPLNVVSGHAQMILTGETRDAAELEHAAHVIVDQAGRMTRIVRQLLDFARRSAARREPADVAKLARDTVAMLGSLAWKRGVRLAGPDAAATAPARVDAEQLQQVITNLVMNAVQASRKGGVVSIRVSARDVAVTPSPRHPPGSHVVIEVEDQGHGVPPDLLPAIFDPFFTTKPLGEGTGLGLAVVYGIVEEHGGWVDVTSEPDKGSCFAVFVPVGEADEPSNPDRR
jgi:two-component system, NtrC family, sensor kinase